LSTDALVFLKPIPFNFYISASRSTSLEVFSMEYGLSLLDASYPWW